MRFVGCCTHDAESGRLVGYSDNCEPITGHAAGPESVAALQEIVDELQRRK